MKRRREKKHIKPDNRDDGDVDASHRYASQLEPLVHLLYQFNTVAIDHEGTIHRISTDPFFQYTNQHRTRHPQACKGSSYSPSIASSLKSIHRMLQTRGTLTQLLTSNDVLETVSCQLSDSALSILLSSLYQSEICDLNESLSGGQQEDETEIETIIRSPNANATKEAGIDVTGRKNRRRSSLAHAILKFVDRVLSLRFPPFQVYDQHDDENSVSILDDWFKVDSLSAGNSASASAEIEDASMWGCPCRTSSSGFWIPSLIFMMAYTTLRNHLTDGISYLSSNEHGEDNDCDRGRKDQSTGSTNRAIKKNPMAMVRRDPLVLIVIRLIFFSKILAINFDRHYCNDGDDHCDDRNGNDSGSDSNGYILKPFQNDMEMVDALIQSLKAVESTMTSSKSHDNDTSPEAEKPKLKVRSSLSLQREDNNHDSRSVFEQVCKEIEALVSSGDEEECEPTISNSTAREKVATFGEQTSESATPDTDSDEVKSKVETFPKKLDSDITTIHYNAKERETLEATPHPTDTNLSSVKAYEQSSLDLRPSLLAMSHNAVATDIEKMTNQIIYILKDAGSQDGASGIQKVASIFQSGSVRVSTNNNENENFVQQPFSDALVSCLSKAYVTNSLSSSRVSSYLQAFVLPSLLALKEPKSRPASRLLVTTLTSLARDRPSECTTALFITTMVGNIERVEMAAASKSQCELIHRIVKTMHLHELPKILSGLIPMKVTDSSVAILTTCVQKKPVLPDSLVVVVVSKLMKSVEEPDLAKSSKFSSFFHVFVNKYSSQLQELNCLNDLLDASDKLKTFMRKAIAASLNKLKK